MVAGGGSALVLLILAAWNPPLLHWSSILVWACGLLIGAEASFWWRSRGRIHTARALVALVGLYFFFITPVLHVVLDTWMLYVVPPDDWRPWVGRFAALNAVGLVLYQLAVRHTRVPKPRSHWPLQRKYLLPFTWIGLAVAFVAQVSMYRRFGGPAGYLATVPLLKGDAFVIATWQTIVAEAFPYLLLVLLALWLPRRKSRRWVAIVSILAVYALVALVFGGLRGSRANVVWPVVMAVVMIDLNVRRIPRAALPVAIGVLVAFTYFYAYFKASGLEGLRALGRPGDRPPSHVITPRLDGVLVADLGRADVQAFLLYRTTRPDSDFQMALGETYLGALTLAVPETLWPAKPATKLVAGTEAQYGRGQLGPGATYSSRIYGLGGEALLNFGWAAVPLSFLILGVVVRRVDGAIVAWRANGDARVVLAPLLIVAVLILLIQDSDVLVFFLIKNCAPPAIMVWLCCRLMRDRCPTVLVRPS